MNDLVIETPRVLPATIHELDIITHARTVLRPMPQTRFVTEHMIHGKMYARTVRLPTDQFIAGVLAKIATITVASGWFTIYREAGNITVEGENIVIPGSIGRMIAFCTHSLVSMTAIFPTLSKNVADIQREFTDEDGLLPPLSDVGKHRFLITGE